MMDYNILNRGSFHDVEIPLEISVNPSQTKKVWHDLGDNSSFLLKEATWRYSVPSGQNDAYGWPRQGLRVEITDAFKAQVANPVALNPPPLLKNRFEVVIVNSSTVVVTVHMTIKGILVNQVPGEQPLSDKEIRGYSLLDDSQKGMLALSESVIDRLDDHLQQLGLEGLRGRLPGGQVANVSMINSELQQFAALPNTTQENLSVDTSSNIDSDTLKSLLIGDLVTCKTSQSLEITLDDISALANFLLDKGWTK